MNLEKIYLFFIVFFTISCNYPNKQINGSEDTNYEITKNHSVDIKDSPVDYIILYATDSSKKFEIKVENSDSLIYHYSRNGKLEGVYYFYYDSLHYLKRFDSIGLPYRAHITPDYEIYNDSIKIGMRFSFYDSVGIGLTFGKTNGEYVIDTLEMKSSERGSKYYFDKISNIPRYNNDSIVGEFIEINLENYAVTGFTKFKIDLKNNSN